MLFSSILFLYTFLPAVLLLYFIAPKRLKNTVLLLASLLFYAWGEPKYVFLMIAEILCAYGFGLLIDRFRGRGASRVFAVLSVGVSIAFLVYFKYADFLIVNFNAATALSLPLLKIALPIGISFYTFQVLSYTLDVYRGTARVQKNLIRFALYVSLFPQLIAGPIVRYTHIEQLLSDRESTLAGFSSGMCRFLLGLSKKVLIANALGELCEIFRAADEKTVLFYWLYAIAFTLHIYFDFSGYSDMAIGLGRIFGFAFPENFNYPYISSSVTEFWRRWHISLGTWFRDYVYIPLGGNRKGRARQILNILIVWMLTGMWHGASWNFILWGLLYGLFLMIEKLGLLNLLQRLPAILSHIYVMLTVILGFVLFNAETLSQALSDIGGLFGWGGVPLVNAVSLYYLRSYVVVLLLAVLGATPLAKKTVLAIGRRKNGEKILLFAEPAVLVVLLLVSTAYLVDGSFNPFLYFRF